MNRGLYIHIPFCRKKCHYCDFASTDRWNKSDLENYVKALTGEMELLERQAGHCLSSVYVGGGTPSLLPGRLWESILEKVHRLFSFEKESEWTVEANPGTLGAEGFCFLRENGFNRVSLGIQSFGDSELKTLGRIHDGAAGTAAVENAVQAGFSNISVDLIQGVPGQSPENFAFNLEKAAALPVKHVSVYELTLEPGTLFHRLYRQEDLELPSDEQLEKMDSLREEILEKDGFIRYEISSYTRPGYASRHNLLYWENRGYFGVGAGACERIGRKRVANTQDMLEYEKELKKGKRPLDRVENIDPEMALEEEIFLGLRLRRGLDYGKIYKNYGVDFPGRYGEIISRMIDKGMMERTYSGIRLTRRGMDWSNQVMAAFMR